MKPRLSLLNLILTVSIIALLISLLATKRELSQANSALKHAMQDSVPLRELLGDSAEDLPDKYSICFFVDAYSRDNEVRWRVKSPEGATYRLMYSQEGTGPELPESADEIRINNVSEFVIAMKFTDTQLQIDVFPESIDGNLFEPRKGMQINGAGWPDVMGRFFGTDAVYADLEPRYFTLEEPFRFLKMRDGSEPGIEIWLEHQGITKR